jgi:hypothetical protein
MGDKLPRVRDDSYGLPGIINTPFNISAAASNIDRISGHWNFSLQQRCLP